MRRALLLLLAIGLTVIPGAAAFAQDADNGEPEDDGLLPRRFRGMEYHPVGWTVRDHRFRFTNLVRMQPAGFRADRFNHWFGPTLGLGKGWEVTAGVTGAERIGPGGYAFFYGAGVQKQILNTHGRLPDVSVGVYGMGGPHDHRSGTAYLSASHRVFGGAGRGFAVDLHTGAKYETYDGDDYGSGSGVRPYLGMTAPVGRRLFLSAEVSPQQPWQESTMYSISATVRTYKRLGITGGVRNNGFETQPFVGISL
ncbi:MAG: hypothetical protein K0Q72_5109 [Armatimonadetes bacterium]|jgi:hypothetical protein|nr:hypothetical protein [Armatimonadota bacterium]